MLYLVILALVAVAVAVAVAVPRLRRPNRLDEVDRFRTASSLTSSWSSGVTGRVAETSGEQGPGEG